MKIQRKGAKTQRRANGFVVIFLLCFFVSLRLCAFALNNTSTCLQHLQIGDAQTALKLAQQAEDLPLQVRSYAALQDIPAMLRTLKHIKNPDSDLLEEVSWAIIRKASGSDSPIIRCEEAIAVFLANDAKGIGLCKKALQDPHVGVRLVANQLAATLRDETICEQLLNSALFDPQPDVREAAIISLGKMQYTQAIGPLKELLSRDEVGATEKLCARVAIAQMSDPSLSLIVELAASSSSSMRALACQLVLEHGKKEALPSLVPLLQDSSSEVRHLALQCVGVFDYPIESRRALMEHQDVKTVLLASWISLRSGTPEERHFAEETFRKWLFFHDRTLRLLAACALSATQAAGISLAKEVLEKSDDPLVCLNVATLLIWQREGAKEAAKGVAIAMAESKERIFWESFGIFQYVAPSKMVHIEGRSRYPETLDLLTRLDLISMIATCDIDNIAEILKPFLKDYTWGITGQTAMLCLQEGIQTPEAIKKLLYDKNPQTALQAAFVLAFYWRDIEAIEVLRQQYKNSTRPIKEQILFAIGAVGSQESLPFLVEVLDEPFESLRVVAARSLLLCLFH